MVVAIVLAMGLGFVVLREPVRPLTLVGAGLIVAGVLLTLPTVQEAILRSGVALVGRW